MLAEGAAVVELDHDGAAHRRALEAGVEKDQDAASRGSPTALQTVGAPSK